MHSGGNKPTHPAWPPFLYELYGAHQSRIDLQTGCNYLNKITNYLTHVMVEVLGVAENNASRTALRRQVPSFLARPALPIHPVPPPAAGGTSSELDDLFILALHCMLDPISPPRPPCMLRV